MRSCLSLYGGQLLGRRLTTFESALAPPLNGSWVLLGALAGRQRLGALSNRFLHHAEGGLGHVGPELGGLLRHLAATESLVILCPNGVYVDQDILIRVCVRVGLPNEFAVNLLQFLLTKPRSKHLRLRPPLFADLAGLFQ